MQGNHSDAILHLAGLDAPHFSVAGYSHGYAGLQQAIHNNLNRLIYFL